jgi:hypothetical protein
MQLQNVTVTAKGNRNQNRKKLVYIKLCITDFNRHPNCEMEEEPNLWFTGKVLKILPSSHGRAGVFSVIDLPKDAMVCVMVEHIPTRECAVVHHFDSTEGKGSFHALALILTIALLRKQKRNAILAQYDRDCKVPVDLMKELCAIMKAHKLIYNKAGVARGTELAQIAAMVVTNNIVCVIDFKTSKGDSLPLEVGCMGSIPCNINHSPEGQPYNVLMLTPQDMDTIKFSEVSDRLEMICFLQLPYGIKKGEELFFPCR